MCLHSKLTSEFVANTDTVSITLLTRFLHVRASQKCTNENVQHNALSRDLDTDSEVSAM